jgi:hypothetical protein
MPNGDRVAFCPVASGGRSFSVARRQRDIHRSHRASPNPQTLLTHSSFDQSSFPHQVG